MPALEKLKAVGGLGFPHPIRRNFGWFRTFIIPRPYYDSSHWNYFRKSSMKEVLRDRPSNLKGGSYGFLFRSEFFFWTTQELEYFFSSREANFFSRI